MHWPDLFVSPSAVEAHDASAPLPPCLGIDFVKASAPEASVLITAVASAAEPQLIVQQSLSRYGIAGVVWNCARALICFVQHRPLLLADKRVLELGAGTGAVGLALAAGESATTSGPAALLLTDLPEVVSLTADNVRTAAQHHAPLQHLLKRGDLAAQAYCWGDVVSDALKAHTDVVLASDCLYEPSQYERLLASLLALTDRPSSSSSVTVVLAYKQRLPARERAFFESASASFAITVDLVDSATCAALGSDTIFICTLSRRRSEMA